MQLTGRSWSTLNAVPAINSTAAWLTANLGRNGDTDYLRQFGSPQSLAAFRSQVPTCDHEDIHPYVERICDGASDVLFKGRPVAYERTGGSRGGAKLIPYSEAGLQDFQHSITPWLACTVQKYGISGKAYFAISPATRTPESIGNIPVGLPDTAYLGEAAGAVVAANTAVPLTLNKIRDVEQWRRMTIEHLVTAADLELISVWSPTFLLRLLDDIPNARERWPRLKVISCWASGSSAHYIPELQRRLPHAVIQPKGLLMTEAVITVPGDSDIPELISHGFVEFDDGDSLLLEDELEHGGEYEVIVTTASGLYRYRTGDRVQFNGYSPSGRPRLEFMGRDNLTSDLAGEKLTEAFVSHCLEVISGFAMLLPEVSRPGYVLICETEPDGNRLSELERRLSANPQYAYARKLNQLAPLRAVVQPHAFTLVENTMLEHGTRLADVKPVALRTEPHWLPLLERETT